MVGQRASMNDYDLAVIGTGPARQKAAIQGAKLGKKVVITEKNNVLGGATINTGTIPSKALREAVMHLTGASKRGIFGESYRVKRNITIADLIYVSQQVIHHELELVRDHFDRNNIDLTWGMACFEDAHTLRVDRPDETELLSADKFIIATGTRPARPANIPFNTRNCFCSDSILTMDHLPKTMIVVGGGVIGTEYACMMATLGVRVTIIEGRNELLGFLDREIVEAFQYHMRAMGMTLRLGEKVAKIEEVSGNGVGKLMQATLESGKKLSAETLLYSVGRQGTADTLCLDKCGLCADDRGRLKGNGGYQTGVAHIYAAGDVIGFTVLASTSMEQGRLAACHAFRSSIHCCSELFSYCLF